MAEIKFRFDTDSEYESFRKSGYIPPYDMARIRVFTKRKGIDGKEQEGYIDSPYHSKQEFDKAIKELEANNQKYEAYQSKHEYDIHDYD